MPEIEVGFYGEGRWTLELAETICRPAEPLPLDRQSVVLVTGGCHGITDRVCRGVGPRLFPPADSDWSLAASVRTNRRAAAADQHHRTAPAFDRHDAQADPSVTPAGIEQALRVVLKSRQIRDNLAELRRLGSTVEYHALDVRDSNRFGRLLDDIYPRHGRIDGVVHGAGVIDDRLIRDKTAESFADVFSTKVNGAGTLARKLQPESLKFLVFFSSISGRFGNIGQADYSAANEYLNKLAQLLDQAWPARVVAINWGPWDAGMVSDPLRKVYKQHGIDLIPPAEGVRSFLIRAFAPGSETPRRSSSRAVRVKLNRSPSNGEQPALKSSIRFRLFTWQQSPDHERT